MTASDPIREALHEVGVTGPVAYAIGIGSRCLVRLDESDGALWDLASLTKPLFTAPVFLQLVGASGLGVQERALLSHSAGLAAELPDAGSGENLDAWVAGQLSGDVLARREVVYSDVGYWHLGRRIEAATGEPLQLSFQALAQTHALGAEFEFGNAAANRCVPVGPVIENRQQVHDPSARRLGGVAGHAGAFGTLDGVCGLVRRWIDGTVLEPGLLREAVDCATHDVAGGHRSLAWTLAGDPYHPVAHDWPGTTLAHTGFTGVSAAWDPQSGRWAVLLSTALPAERDARAILMGRRLFHAAAARECDREVGAPGAGGAEARERCG